MKKTEKKMLCLKRVTLSCVVWLCHSFCPSFANGNTAAVTVSPETQRVKENGVVSFHCHLSADIGNSRISWFKSDRQISEKNPKYMIVGMNQGSVLRVVPARKRDEGTYECRASDDHGTSSATGQLGIYAEGRAPPGFPQIRDLQTKVIEKNHNDVLQCLVTGEPPPTISWLKDYLPINATNPRIRSISGGKLQIQRAQESDMGKYECVATNSFGVAHSNGAYVYVKERQVPPQFSRPPESVEVMPGGSVNLTCVAIGSPMPYVKWIHGAVEMTPPGSLPPIGLNVLKLSRVVESTTYTCEASSTLGIITAQAEVRLKDLPQPPVDVVLAEVTSDSVTLSWKSGNDDVTESYIIRYINRLKTSSGTDGYVQVTDVTDTEYTVSDLVPFTAYSFQVMAVNSIGTSAPSAVLEVTTHESIPGTAPLNVRARPVSSSTVAVQWEEPLKPNGQIKGYKVYYSLKLDVPLSLWMSVEVGNSLVTTISNLYTNRSYGVKVLAFTNIGNGPPSDVITVITQQGVPEQPGNVRGTPLSATSIELAWEPSDAFSKNFDSYEIFGVDVIRRRNFTFSVSPSQTSYVLEGLSPNTRYSFRVAAKSQRGMGPMSAQTEVSTLESAPSAAPQKVEGEAIDSTTIRVRWNPPKERDQNGVITGYRVRYGVASEDAVVAPVPSTETAFVATNLRKWTPYRISILAHTEFGDGPYSDTVTVYTAEDVPGEPRRFGLDVINSASIGVHWRPPAKQELNGVIRGYLVYYLALSDDGSHDGMQHSLDTLNGSQTSIAVAGLTPDKEYQFQIAAYTRKGDGQRTRPKKIRTKAAAPRNFQLTLKSSSPPVVLATWDQPQSSATKLGTYRLDYRRFGSEGWNQKTLPADSNRFQSSSTEKLLNGVEYEFRLAVQRGLLGDFASQTIFIPENVPTGPPVNLRYSMWSTNKVKIQWDSPSFSHASSVLYYEIFYRSDDDDLDDEVYQRNSSEAASVVENLKPSTDYFFQVSACSMNSCGPKSEALLVELVEPDLVTVEDVQASRTSPDEITVTWKRPEIPPSLVVEYVVYYNPDPQANFSAWFYNDATSDLIDTLLVPNAEVSYYVSIRVKLSNETFGPYTDAIEVKSSLNGFHSDAVWNVRTLVEGLSSIRINWSPPKKPGLSSYNLEYGASLQHENGSVIVTPSTKHFQTVQRDEVGVLVEGLSPGTSYVFTVSANFLDGNRGLPKSVRARTLEGLAAPVIHSVLSPSSARLYLSDVSIQTESSNISYFLVIVVPGDLAETRDPNTFSMAELTAAANDADSSMSAWIAAKFKRSDLPESLDIGDSSRLGTGEFNNRPLSKELSYRVFTRLVYTDTKSVSSPYSEELSFGTVHAVESMNAADSDMRLLGTVAPVCAAVVFLLLVVLGVVFFRRSRRSRRAKQMASAESPLLWPIKNPSNGALEFQQLRLQTQEMANHPPILIHELARHVENLKENDRQRFSLEYESIEPGEQFTWDASNVEVNKPKNRYANVIAYDHSRVALHPIDGAVGSDYINANFIDGRRRNAYIATQGPLPETFGDFWRMVWEQKCQTIVMMTKLEERNRVKCDQYWPIRGTEVYDVMQVTITDVMELASYTVRTFIITKSNSFEKREVRQFQFTAWPDHGVPDHPTPLLTFIRRIKTIAANDVGPIVVHCSAGVGRTGAFIVIDAMLDRLEREKTVDIYGYVTCLRAQRNYMVQTEDQYIFIHEALIEAIESGDTEIPADNLFVRIQHLTQTDPKEGISRMELEFRKISEMKIASAEFLGGSMTVNKLKNRLVNILPYDSSRVCLQSIRGVEGSDYINASFIDGYRNRHSFIATQAPLVDTTEDFWRMLWENNCTIIVMLTKLREMGCDKCHQYWPEERSARYQYFVVDPINQYAMHQFILREFKVTDARDGQSRMIRHFQFMDWPEQGVPNSGEGFIEFIGHIQKTREQVGQDGPIVVHCSTGFGRTGVFLTLSIVLEQMRFEGVVDMFQTVKMLRTQRPAMVQTEDQYTFCYRAALEYLSSFDHYAR